MHQDRKENRSSDALDDALAELTGSEHKGSHAQIPDFLRDERVRDFDLAAGPGQKALGSLRIEDRDGDRQMRHGIARWTPPELRIAGQRPGDDHVIQEGRGRLEEQPAA